ncbi:LPXTG-motif cell wall-anchored protein [Enterococcus rotai]|uniref:Gram-positive cocci surface proteins LPxTG domain-containing protein n=1 Tax=Enterococcus rotai TaxID=118060 RepID=A0A0U2MVM8_9ENTE|nr:LPXTG cell wall anchor domain-containing protein [Enterococcus rotai]ALS36451.1 hypothetical protein ATZ35_04520 [Enterococcus rotai]
MKKEKSIYFIFAIFLLYFFLGIKVEIAAAVEGAEVPTEGEIVLYDETLPSSEEPKLSSSSSSLSQTTKSSTTPSSQLTKSSASSEMVAKPKGRLPSTGELVKKSALISGVALIGAMLFFYGLNRYRKNKEKE